MKIKNWIFDYDGTIAKVPVDWLDARSLFRERLFDLCGLNDDELNGVRLDEMEEEVLTRFPDLGAAAFAVRQELESAVSSSHRPLDGTVGLIRRLADEAPEVRLFVISNNLRETVMSGLKHLNLDGFFEGFYCLDDVGVPKPNRAAFDLLNEAYSVDLSESVFIGDSEEIDGTFCERTELRFVLVGSEDYHTLLNNLSL